MERSADAGLDEAAAGVMAGQERKRAMGRGLFCASSSLTRTVSPLFCRSNSSTSGFTSSASESIFSGGMRKLNALHPSQTVAEG
jgi:hypothetical protein